MNQLQLLGAVEIGLIYSLVAIGVYITFKVIDFPDLTVDGSFTLGAAVSSSMIYAGFDPYLSTFVAILSGGFAGIITGYLNVRWDILGLLAGILTMTTLYSINLRIMGRPNIAIIDSDTVFGSWSIIGTILIVTIITIILLTRFFASEFGLAVRAVGINPKVSSSYGINVGIMKIVALSISNGIVAFAGSLFAQSQGFADISMGTGTIIVGLASVIIGEALVNPERVWVSLLTCAIGSILYRVAIAFALNAHDIGLEASDLNMITALLVALTMIFTKLRKKRGARSV
ncbi:MAG: ABC transporter permease [Rickettsiaceae bacterium]|nr:ABC transporter permease [Rickettsiaceae bacterium]MDP4833025.1 ABC transporter permease [Rickettsiaceae bacterium]MDP5020622.1 ABC transporter permease [Rickettsiaceae bacterium]MDP5083033.1 ABC transporter permease [Rickettsiaceae bacterium]